MAQNCSTDVSLIIEHIDSVLTTGTADEIYALKDMFGLAYQSVRTNGRKTASTQATVNSSSSAMLSRMLFQDLTLPRLQLVLALILDWLATPSGSIVPNFPATAQDMGTRTPMISAA
jgi:hypothetical protein